MNDLKNKLQELKQFQDDATIRIQSLGQFNLWRDHEKVNSKEFGRDKTVQLLQYLVSNRTRHALHKEKIMDHLWEDGNDRDFKVAMHGVNKVLEPNRPSRTEASFVIRQGVSYQLDLENVWIDVEALEQYIIIGNEAFGEDLAISKTAYKSAIALYKGVFLPNRVLKIGRLRNAKKFKS
jgi:two-component SAPR family response regulator